MTLGRWVGALMACWVVATPAFAEPDTFLLGNGQDGAKTVSGWELHNAKAAQVTEVLSVGESTISLAANPGFVAGELILVLQTRGLTPEPGTNGGSPVDLSTSSAGVYEFARIQSVSSNTLILTAPLWRAYASSVTQVIHVPEYTTVTINSGSGLYPPDWNGTTGGVLVFLAQGAVINNGDLENWAAGFRGGTLKVNSSTTGCTALDQAAGAGAGKGEGLAAGYPSVSGRGYRANGAGGGVCLNSGGGGGGGAAPGGIGGNAIGGAVTGGMGGAEVEFLAYERLFFGGGGGAGQRDGSGLGAGGNGAGVVYIRAASLSGTGWIYADAGPGGDAADDGAGGGGGGGTVVVRLTGTAACGEVSAWGGNGGNVTTGTAPGPGGGGGGGHVFLQGTSWGACPVSLLAGISGDTSLGQLNGAGPGVPGVSTVVSSAFALPPAPTFNAVNTPDDDSTPTFSGTVAVANPPHQISVFIDGVWRANVSSDSSSGAWSYTPSSLSNGTHTAYARSLSLGVHSNASTVRTFVVDTVTPGTSLTSTPAARTRSDAPPTFSFVEVEGTSTTAVSFQCQVDFQSYATCTSPHSVFGLTEGEHTFRVRARDAAGNVDTTPAEYTWIIDDTAPGSRLVPDPPVLTNQQVLVFTLEALLTTGETTATFECTLDGAGFTGCTSPFTTPALGEGPHHLEVRATDEAGNTDATPYLADWQVDLTAPVTTLESAPPATTRLTAFRFTFRSDEDGTFECNLDGAGFTPCISPVDVDLPNGPHTFEVRAIDQAGNQDATPEAASWLIDTTLPEPGHDSDGDGLPDTEELEVGTSPDRADTDQDGLTDFIEVRYGGSDPLDGDSDDDGLRDGMEDANWDGQHQALETSPLNRDTDGDGLSDGVESGLQAPQSADTDPALFVADAQPSTTTHPLKADTDGDGLDDGVEDVNRDGAKGTTETDPAQADTDADGLGDGVELRGGNPTDPLNADCDQDQLLDGEEDTNQNGARDPDETDPNDPDSDDGGVLDGVERQGTSNPLDGNDDYAVRGGGCAAAGAGPLWSLGLLVLAGARRRLRLPLRSGRAPRARRARGAGLLGLVVAMLWPAASWAQPSLSTAIDLQQLKPAPGAGGLLGLHGGQLDPHLGWRAGFFVSYGASPLTLVVTANDQPVNAVVSGQATGDLLGAISLWNRLEMGLALPVTYQLTDTLIMGGGATSLAPVGIGDLRLVPKVRLLDVSGFNLALVAEVTAPTAGGASFLGASGFSTRPRLVVDYRPLEFLRVLFNGGVNLRAPQRLLNLVVGHELTYGGAVEGALPWAGLHASLGVAGAYGLGRAAGPVQPLELLGSARLPLGRSFELTLGGGAGLGNGYGSPSFRVLGGISYVSGAQRVELPMPPPPPAPKPVPASTTPAPTADGCDSPERRAGEDGCPEASSAAEALPESLDPDGDGVPNTLDLCPGIPGDALEDGCPPDDDNDGIVNPLDLCPTRKEVINGFEDDDGCPDRTPRKSRRRRR